jgi:pimeloyl-ACP methyl ester carboxylesterase/quercetin dioxygenase-like cupin family protein
MEETSDNAGRVQPRQDWFVESADGTRLACRSVGDGQPIVLVHGSLAAGAAWSRVAELLARGHRVTTFDRRGRGGSGDGPDYALEREVEDVIAVLEAVGGRAVLMGHSFGGAVAAEVARRVDLAALVLYEPGLRLDGAIGGDAIADMERALRAGDVDSALLTGWQRVVGFDEDDVRAAKESPLWKEQLGFISTWPRELRALDDLKVVPGDFADIRTPTLLLRGTESAAWLRDATERISGLIPGATLVELVGQGHGASDSAPEMVVGDIRRFVDDAEANSDGPVSVVRLRSDTAWNGTRYESYPAGRPQLTVVRYSIPPHSSLPWHRHDAPNTAFVISGAITLQSIGGVEHVFRAGDAFAESVGDEHRGFTVDEAAEIVCTYAAAAGVPLSVPTGRLSREG